VRAELLGKSLNAGIARAPIYVVKDAAEFATLKWDPKAIYVLQSTPPTIKPVAGLLTHGPGSLVSHVQLLCRSLGIPNSAIHDAEFEILKGWHGREDLYVAYDQKPVIVKPAFAMTEG
jgi:hypothetical protein